MEFWWTFYTGTSALPLPWPDEQGVGTRFDPRPVNKSRRMRIPEGLPFPAIATVMRVREFLVVVLLLLSGCAPGVAPLFRDFSVPVVERAVLLDRIRAALAEAGWEEGPPIAAEVVTTEPRVMQRWGLYYVEMRIDVLPVGERHVRVIFHPYRHFVTRSRGKIGYLTRRLERAVVPELSAAFERQGITLLGHAVHRDRKRVRGR